MKKHIMLSFLCIASCSYTMDDQSANKEVFSDEYFDKLIAEAQKNSDEPFPSAYIPSGEQTQTCSEFFCKLCNKSFESEDIYDEMTHMENVHHQCTVCKQTFNAGHEVRWHHTMTHIKKEDLKPHG